MKKIKTIKKNYEFKRVLDSGKYELGKQIIIYVNKTKNPYNRIGIAINNKLCHAYMRNRLKRLIREGYYKYMNDIKQGYDIVVLWNKKCEIDKADVAIITNDFNTIFNKFELFN